MSYGTPGAPSSALGELEPNWPIERIPLRGGSDGIRDTLGIMAGKAREESIENDVRTVGVSLARGAPQADDVVIADQVRAGIRGRWHYIKDPLPFEYVIAPKVTAWRFTHGGLYPYQGWGDCDDLSIFQAGILTALGIPARFVAIGTRRGNGKYSHVFCEVRLNGEWYSMDHLVPHDAEWLIPEMIKEV